MRNELLHFAKVSGKQCLGYLLLMIVMNIFLVSTVFRSSTFMINSIFLVIMYIMLNGSFLFFLVLKNSLPDTSNFYGLKTTHFNFISHAVYISVVVMAFLDYLWHLHLRFPKDPFLDLIFFLF